MNKVLSAQPNEQANALMLTFSSSIRNYTILGVLVWFFSALIAGWFGFFSQPDAPPPHLGLFIAPPLIVFTVLYLASASFRSFAHSIPLPFIVGAHVWRYIGLGFIIAYLFGKLPPEFAIPEGTGDIIAAVFSLPLALALYRGKPVSRGFVAWNIFGLADLVSAITMGVLYSQGPLGILRTGVSTALMTSFPIHLIPTFFVPLFILLHLLALARRKEVVGSSKTGKERVPVMRGSSTGGFANARLEDAGRSEDDEN